MIKLGDCITVKPATFDVPGKDGKPKAIPGTVVYVHPAGRYCVLEFDVKSLVTLLLSGVFAYLAITGQTSQEFMTVYTVVIAFYFGTQTQKISDAVEKTTKEG